jgi:CubicO group peptidase (beta-lactamase class C family)
VHFVGDRDGLSLILSEEATASEIPGVCIALTGPDGDVTLTHGRDASVDGRPVGQETWFQAASTGKHLTACLVLDLVAQGLVSLERPIGVYLPDAPARWRGRTVRALLTHTSGLPEYLAYTDGEEAPTREDAFYTRYADLAPEADEGAGWGYSNTNYILLGFLIRRVSGRSYAEAMDAYLARLGLEGVAVASPGWVRGANAAGIGLGGADPESAAREVIGDGDMAFTVAGALAWLKMLLRNGEGALPGRTHLFAPTLLRTERVALYGAGWFNEPFGASIISHHAGHYDGWTAMAYLNHAMGCGAIGLCNLAPGSTRAIRGLTQRVLEAYAPGATWRGLPVLTDDAPDLTARAIAALFRNGQPPDRDLFAGEFEQALSTTGVRRVLDFSMGGMPSAISLVDDTLTAHGRFRRYRLSHPDRMEHLTVGFTPEGRIHWAWPL